MILKGTTANLSFLFCLYYLNKESIERNAEQKIFVQYFI